MSPSRTRLLGALLFVVGLAACGQAGTSLLDGFVLDLGELDWPAPRHRLFLGVYFVCGLLTTGGAFLALRDRDPLGWLEGIPGPVWRIAGPALALLGAVAVQHGVLGGVGLTDDEEAYRFGAELLLTGRVTAPLPPLPLHFAHPMVVAADSWHPAYFLGWPALLAPFVALGLGGLANPFLAALLIPALDGILERVAGRRWGRAAVVAWLLAPMPVFLAATGLSHTACLCALAWTGWCALRSPEGARWSAGVGLAFAVAFFVRPVSALAVGGPLLVLWAVDGVRGRRWAHLVAAGVPAVLLAGAFLGVNLAQNGSPWLPSYVAGAAYHEANGFRFAMPAAPDAAVLAVQFSPAALGTQTGAGLLRLWFAAFGWPCSFVFLLWARDWRWWSSLLGGLAGAAVVLDVGFDTFGPVHYSEVLLPLVVLTGLGAAGAGRRFGDRAAGALLVGLVLSSLAMYWPVRVANASRIAWSIQRPLERVRQLDDAVVFAMWPWTAQNCDIAPTRHLRLARPLPHPDLTGPVVWANHLTLPSDRRLMERFPGRTGYLLFYDAACAFQLVPLDSVADGQVRDAFVGGNGDLSGYR
jgi:4-amino-4-deoxy-L-arabinose transferase-like glycosyltransferase